MKLPLTFNSTELPNAAAVIYDADSTPIAHIQPIKDKAMRDKRSAQIVGSLNLFPSILESLSDTLALARIKWGNLDPDANTIFEKAKKALDDASTLQLD